MKGNTIKELRENLGLSQVQLAQKIGVSDGAVGMWESGKRMPGKTSLSKLSSFFNVSTDYLLGYSDNPKTAEQLTDKDEKDIAKSIQKIKEQLLSEESLMFEGEALKSETRELLLSEFEQQERLAKLINKKYTPKKYIK